MTIKKWTLGETIKFVRQRLKLSQSKLAAFVGVDRGSILRWEKGQAAEEMKLKYFLKIAQATHTEPSELFEVYTGCQPIPESTTEHALHCINSDTQNSNNGMPPTKSEQKTYGKHRT